MGSTPSTEIQTVLDKLKSRGVSDKDIESFVSYIKQNTIDYEWIVNDISDKSKSKLYTYFEDELNNDTLFDTLCSIITNKDKSSKEFERAKLSYPKRTQCSFSPSRRQFSSAISIRSCSASVSMDSIGLSLGGARDTNNFRKCIDKKVMPSVNSITYNGLLYEYYFDTGTISRKHEPKLDETTENKDECALFYPSYCYAKINKLSFDDKMDNNEREYFMSVGLNSNIKQNEFKRKHLNVLILLDISGSMTASFDYDNTEFDVDINGEWRNELHISAKVDVKDNRNWYPAQIIQVNKDAHSVTIHYIGWEDKYDECISINSDRLAPFNSSNTKMNSAKNAILSILKQLTAKDRLALVTFNREAEMVQNMQFVHDLDINKLKEKIEGLSAQGGTNFEIGYNRSMQVYSALFNDNEYKLNSMDDDSYDHRIIAFTDAQPNEGRSTSHELFPLIKESADNTHIYTTFVGVGLDFNASLIEKISAIRGCNYYSVKSTKEFDDKMNDEFEFMVTPLVFNVCLKLKCEGNSLQIEKVYGSNNEDAANIMKTGEIARIHTLFPSKKSESTGETKGGIQLIKLKKLNDDGMRNTNVELQVTFEDRNGKKYENIQNVTFKAPEEKVMNNNDMIEVDEKEKEEMNINFYDNTGIRKAILLCQYVDLMKKWIQVDGTNNFELKMNDEYKTMFNKFTRHFKVEMSECGDDTLQKEVDLMDKLVNLSN